MMQQMIRGEVSKIMLPPVYLQAFAYLQLLDFLSTMIGLRLGLSEASPTIRPLIDPLGVAGAIAASKLLAFSLAGFCLATGRERIVRWINYWFAALVVWNMMLIMVVLMRS